MVAFTTGDNNQQPIMRWPVNLVGSSAIALGLLGVITLIYTIATHEAIFPSEGAVDSNQDALWHFVKAFGILRPLLTLAGSGMLVRLGFGLFRRWIGSARWARTILAWSVLITAAGLILAIANAINQEQTSGVATGSSFVTDALPWSIALLYATALYLVLNRHMHLYGGDENVSSQRARTAWNLLTPILIVFFLIGIGPLEQVFITSLTNEDFAIGIQNEADFVGLSNFTNLLSIRVDEIPCTTDDTGNCLSEIDENGNEIIVYPRARRYLRDNVAAYRVTGDTNLASYVPFTEFDLFGHHYALSVRDPDFIDSVVNSVIYSVVAIFLQLVIGLFMAMVLTSKLRGMSSLRVAMLVPLAIPTLIATQFWEVMLGPDATGLVNSALLQAGMINEPRQWLLEPGLQIPSLILVIVWKETPSMALLLLPGLLSISPEIYQAASVDGANRFQRFYRITLPMLRPAIGVALILRTMVMLRVFDVFEVLLGRSQFSMASYAYDRLTQESLLGYSSAVSVVIFTIILAFTIIYMRILNIDEI